MSPAVLRSHICHRCKRHPSQADVSRHFTTASCHAATASWHHRRSSVHTHMLHRCHKPALKLQQRPCHAACAHSNFNPPMPSHNAASPHDTAAIDHAKLAPSSLFLSVRHRTAILSPRPATATATGTEPHKTANELSHPPRLAQAAECRDTPRLGFSPNRNHRHMLVLPCLLQSAHLSVAAEIVAWVCETV